MIHYIGFFCDFSDNKRKNISPAMVTKMRYVARKLAQRGKKVKIFSPGYSIEKNADYSSSKKYVIEPNVEVEETATIGRKYLLLKALGVLFAHLQLLIYLFSRVKRGDIVVIYHSMFYKYDFLLFKLLRKNKIIMEVEELYSAAWCKKDFSSEIHYLSRFDGYIYVNDIMNDRFGFGKPFAVCYGNYSISSNYCIRDNYQKLIYAGVLGKEGSDVELAIDIMTFLPDSYSLKIAGYGSEDDVDFVKNKIGGKKNIEYVGFLSGKEYEDFLLKGDVGLCTRVLANNFSDYTFPSKVLVYLTHGLVPICPSIDCLMKSDVSAGIMFYADSTPEKIALSIKNILSIKPSDQLLTDMDEKFGRSLIRVISA